MRKLTKTAAVVASMAVMAMGATVMTSAAQEGWVQKGSDWYYYVNGNAVENQWVLAGKDWYFLGDDGKMLTNAFINDNEEVEIDDSTDTYDFDATDEDDPYYFVDNDGKMVTGWKKIDYKKVGGITSPTDSTNWYYFGGSGNMLGDAWVMADEKWYYICDNGIMVKNTYVDYDDDLYYLGKDGVMVSGWYKLTDDDETKSGKKWGDDRPEYTGNGLNNPESIGASGTWVFADTDGELQTGWVKENSKWYYLGSVTTTSIVGTQEGRSEIGDYQMNEDTFIFDGSKYFYLKSNGALQTGWFKVDGKKYNAKSSGEIRRNDITTVDGKNYFFESDGTYQDDGYAVKYVLDGKTIKKVLDASSVSTAEDEVNNEIKKAGVKYTIYKLGSSSTYSKTSK